MSFNKQKKEIKHNELPQEFDYGLIICYYNIHKTRMPVWKGGGRCTVHLLPSGCASPLSGCLYVNMVSVTSGWHLLAPCR